MEWKRLKKEEDDRLEAERKARLTKHRRVKREKKKQAEEQRAKSLRRKGLPVRDAPSDQATLTSHLVKTSTAGKDDMTTSAERRKSVRGG